jgi:hydrogenase nickel incorporation protein HypA/HybF
MVYNAMVTRCVRGTAALDSAMHEVVLAEAVWRQVATEMASRPGRKLLGIGLAVGKWSGADPESLQFALKLVAEESPWPEAEVRIRPQELVLSCRACSRRFEPEELNLACPGCGAFDADTVAGRDVLLESLELDDPSA